MTTELLDSDAILSINEEWSKLDEVWGMPIDLETDDEPPALLSPVFSSLDLRKSTFDSSFLQRRVRKQVGRRLSKRSPSLDYKDFLQDLKQEPLKRAPSKQFYFIGGQIISAMSVEEICENIDDIFKSVDKLCSATSTIRSKKVAKPKLPDVVHCSISASDLSFDDTIAEGEEKEKSDNDDVDRYIDEVFEQLGETLASIEELEETARETVTTLVRKFTAILKSPKAFSPKKKRQCCDRFRSLAEFWQNRVEQSGN